MKTVFIGAGRGCCAVFELFEQGRLEILDLEILGALDTDPNAPGMRFARDKGWRTMVSISEALALPQLELVIELTGSDEVLEQVYRHLPPGVRVMDHVMARVFWDLEKVTLNLREQLQQRAAIEERLVANRAELQEILDTIPDVVMVVDRAMRIRWVNRRFELVTGRSRSDVSGLACREALSGSRGASTCEAFADVFATVMDTTQPVSLIQRQIDFGSEGHFEIAACPILDERGRVLRVVQTSREITQEVMLKRETEQHARQFRQMVDAVDSIITIKDLEGRYQRVNPRGERTYGKSEQAMIGHTAGELFAAEVADTMEMNDRIAWRDGEVHGIEETLSFDGRECILVSHRFVLTDHDGQPVGLCCVARDETRSRLLQRDLLQTERLTAVGKLAAGVAHELNNPLTGVLTFAEDLLFGAERDDPLRADYDLILNEALRCRAIVRDLLDFSRQRTPERRPLNINQVIRRALTMLGRQASFHDVDLEVRLAPDLPHVLIDAMQITQAIVNLVINARDAVGGRGRIVVRTEPDDDGRTVSVAVTDSGCGVPDDQLGRIFEPFFSTKGEHGNGLGLPAVQAVVEQHGGTIEVTSKLGLGSTFRLVLPAVTSQAEHEVPTEKTHDHDGRQLIERC